MAKKTNKHAKALSALGASKGGKARASVLTPAERSEMAREAVRARWKKAGKLRQTDKEAEELAVVGPAEKTQELGPSKPYSMFKGSLTLGNIDLECHVLNDGRRVFTQREVVRAVSGGRDSGNLTRYLSRNPLTAKGFDAGPVIEFDVRPNNAVGYEATLLVEICDKYLEARDIGLLKPSQMRLAAQAEIILRACAKVGIIALVDEATGFQRYRAKNALRLKLQAFIADEMQEWARMFPEEFWLQLARLEGIRYSPRNRPLRWGKYVMMFVYDAIDPDVGRELRKRNPSPRFLKNHHQWLKQFGRQRVHDQIQQVIVVMKLCVGMDDFRVKFKRAFKKAPLQLAFEDIDWRV